MRKVEEDRPTPTEEELIKDHEEKVAQNAAQGNSQEGNRFNPFQEGTAQEQEGGVYLGEDRDLNGQEHDQEPSLQDGEDIDKEHLAGPEGVMQAIANRHRETRSARLQDNAVEALQRESARQNSGGNHSSIFGGGTVRRLGQGIGKGIKTIGTRIGDYRSKAFYAGMLAADTAFNNYVDSVSQLNNYLDQSHGGAVRTFEDLAKAKGKTPQEMLKSMFSANSAADLDPASIAARDEIKRVFQTDPHAKDLLNKVENNLNDYMKHSLEAQDEFIKISRGKDVDVDYMKEFQESMNKQLDTVKNAVPKLTDKDLQFSEKMEEMQKKIDEIMLRIREATQKILRTLGLG